MIVSRSMWPRADWDAFVAADPDGWIWHLSPWLDYLAAAGRRDESIANIECGRVIGLAPIMTPVPPDDPLPAPLGDIASRWFCRSNPRRNAPTARGFSTMVLDLSSPLPALWSGVRKSYHALIHRAEERYTVQRRDVRHLRSIYLECPQLPQLEERQWDCLQVLATRGLLRVYTAEDRDRIVGATGVYVWKNWAYYGHGRSIETGASHLLQWAIILQLKTEGLPHYEVGWAEHPGDDDKARRIAHFKAGFGGSRWWVAVNGER